MSTASIIDMGNRNSSVHETLGRFRQLFNNLCAGNMAELGSVYSDNVRFTDPFTTVRGIDELTEYFTGAYANVISCGFDFGDPVINGEDVCIPWVMHLQHKRILKGKAVKVDGISQLVIREGRVLSHRDYFDAGQLLYENLPIMGGIIRWIRNQAG
ncbi:nuclear transport factor 2 family protein [Marinobacter panjinensis]|uniref:Nuclear transport factor 2 family protein n=1 Tax=Marinobacter panjinensis TaxID=2576384 RepID=A0A4U6R0V3_9GAMM|nr:nuclear transport factor 2 family protein [Marinobacter panjinensis]MCR8915953.1 nuclear transport factor 2 family protein [Marinobacter panjinensis]TKV67080.1 nuclear transport factor 2 family protein [Marinobacter panjinensis]